MFGQLNSSRLRINPCFKMVTGSDAGPAKQPFGTDLWLVPPLQGRVERDRLFTRILQVHLQMILQVFTNARQMVNQWYGMRF